LRHDALDSNEGNLPKAKGGFAPEASKAVLAAVNLNTTIFIIFYGGVFLFLCFDLFIALHIHSFTFFQFF
jgi:hypothetical protein